MKLLSPYLLNLIIYISIVLDLLEAVAAEGERPDIPSDCPDKLKVLINPLPS